MEMMDGMTVERLMAEAGGRFAYVPFRAGGEHGVGDRMEVRGLAGRDGVGMAGVYWL